MRKEETLSPARQRAREIIREYNDQTGRFTPQAEKAFPPEAKAAEIVTGADEARGRLLNRPNVYHPSKATAAEARDKMLSRQRRESETAMPEYQEIKNRVRNGVNPFGNTAADEYRRGGGGND